MTFRRPATMSLDEFLKNPEAKPTNTTTNRSVSHTDDGTAERRSAAPVTRTDRGGMFGTARSRGQSAEKYDPDYDRNSLGRGRGGPR